jgi:hypothetical protein
LAEDGRDKIKQFGSELQGTIASTPEGGVQAVNIKSSSSNLIAVIGLIFGVAVLYSLVFTENWRPGQYLVQEQRYQYQRKIDDLSDQVKELKKQIDGTELKSRRKKPNLTLYIEPISDNREPTDSAD